MQASNRQGPGRLVVEMNQQGYVAQQDRKEKAASFMAEGGTIVWSPCDTGRTGLCAGAGEGLGRKAGVV
jgi:hypothetical protein